MPGISSQKLCTNGKKGKGQKKVRPLGQTRQTISCDKLVMMTTLAMYVAVVNFLSTSFANLSDRTAEE
jgi:hypothetical protein